MSPSPRARSPLGFPVTYYPNGGAAVVLPDGSALYRSEAQIAALLVELVAEDPPDEWKILLGRRLAGEARFREFLETMTELAAYGPP